MIFDRRFLVALAGLLLVTIPATVLAEPGPGDGPDDRQNDAATGHGDADGGGENATDRGGFRPTNEQNQTNRSLPVDAAKSDEDEEGRDQNNGNGKGRNGDAGASRGRNDRPLGVWTGRSVAFNATADGLTAYSVAGTPVFASIVWSPSPGFDVVTVHGAAVRMRSGGDRLDATDNPTGQLRLRASGTINLTLAPGLTFAALDDDRYAIVGPMRTLGSIRAEDAQLTGAGSMVATDEVRFAAGVGARPPPRSAKIDDAIGDGQVAVEVKVAKSDRVPKVEVLKFGAYEVDIVSAQDGILVTIDGQGEGRVMLFELEHDALGPIEDLVIRFDGEVIEAADDLDDVLNVSAGEGSEYLILVGRNATQVLVQIPAFSVHTIELQSLTVRLPDVAPGSVGALLGAAAIASAFVAATWKLRTRHR